MKKDRFSIILFGVSFWLLGIPTQIIFLCSKIMEQGLCNTWSWGMTFIPIIIVILYTYLAKSYLKYNKPSVDNEDDVKPVVKSKWQQRLDDLQEAHLKRIKNNKHR